MYKAGMKNHKESLKDLVYGIRMAFHAKNKDFKEYFNPVERVDKKRRKPTKAEIQGVRNLLSGK